MVVQSAVSRGRGTAGMCRRRAPELLRIMMEHAYAALLRGINVGGRNLIPMARLREICSEMGWLDVRTYIQSGNVVLRADGPPASLEEALESTIETEFGVAVPVIVRSAATWQTYAEVNPFPDESRREPNRVMLMLSKQPPDPNAVDRIRERAADDERVELAGGELWIHYGSGSGRSKLSPTFLDRVVGSPVTARNWNTVVKLAEMLSS